MLVPPACFIHDHAHENYIVNYNFDLGYKYFINYRQ